MTQPLKVEKIEHPLEKKKPKKPKGKAPLALVPSEPSLPPDYSHPNRDALVTESQSLEEQMKQSTSRYNGSVPAQECIRAGIRESLLRK